jgi:predicted RNA-binding Zn-ribbon protein involved in translation (DUF1610 family)
VNTYRFHVGNAEEGGAEMWFTVEAGSRWDAVQKVKEAFEKASEGVPVLEAETLPGGIEGVAVWVDPKTISKDDIVEGPYDENEKCPSCGHAPLEALGEPCEVAEQSMRVQDYYGDESVFKAIGAHNTGWRCPECGEEDADVCVHD